jgi:hypothetical protein
MYAKAGSLCNVNYYFYGSGKRLSHATQYQRGRSLGICCKFFPGSLRQPQQQRFRAGGYPLTGAVRYIFKN